MKENQSDREPAKAETETGAPSLLSEDSLYDALSSRRRRRLLYLLLDREARTVDELATVITGWDATEAGGMATPDDRDAVLTSLLHVHLPHLEDAGLIQYDREQGVVQIEPFEAVVADLITRSVEAEPDSLS